MSEKQAKHNRSVSAKVLGFGLAVLTVFGTAWSVYWLKRAPYIEPPRAALSPPSMLIPAELAEIGSPREGNEVSGGIADRWFPLVRAVATPTSAPVSNAPDPAVVQPAPNRVSPSAPNPIGDAVETPLSLSGQVPLPRRRPVLVEPTDPPLPRSRPGGSAPQSVFIAVDANDDRYPN